MSRGYHGYHGYHRHHRPGTLRIFLGLTVGIGLVLATAPPGIGDAATARMAVKAAARITVSPGSVHPGDAVTVTGAGFATRSNGVVTLDGVTVATFRTDARGTFSVAWKAPAGAAAGTRTVLARARTTSASAPIAVLALQPAPAPDPAPAPATANPFAGATWFIDPDSHARRQADAWRASRPADAAQLDKIAAQPQADWFGDWSGNVADAVRRRVSQISATGALPVLVAYNIPLRDCGSYSGGGATSPEAYRQWIRDFARGIDGRKAVVILEPDALGLLDCLSPADQQTRLALLKDAVGVLSSPNVTVYIDAGNASWVAAPTMAARLRQAGIEQARGVSLNVANFMWTERNIDFARQLRAQLGRDIYAVIDTSRNGLGPTADGQWCNPPERALGARATAATADPIVDAYFWVKRPGESDGPCHGGPPAGAWWADYALGLARRAAY